MRICYHHIIHCEPFLNWIYSFLGGNGWLWWYLHFIFPPSQFIRLKNLLLLLITRVQFGNFNELYHWLELIQLSECMWLWMMQGIQISFDQWKIHWKVCTKFWFNFFQRFAETQCWKKSFVRNTKSVIVAIEEFKPSRSLFKQNKWSARKAFWR